MIEHVLKGKGELAVGPTTEIVDYRDKGLKLVGPLPAAMPELHVVRREPGR